MLPSQEIMCADMRLEIDDNVLRALPAVREVVSLLKTQSESAWARASRIDVTHNDGSFQSYFMKVSRGHHGRESLRGEFESTSAIYAITPDFCPKPIAWGTLASDPNSHFYLCKFYHFSEGLPDPSKFCAQLAKLHSSHNSPGGRFGFHAVTYNGDLPQDNTWSDSWEMFFINGLKHVLSIREERAGSCAELDQLLPAMLEKVIPRLLRPLETGGNSIRPSLVHGDLWCGNAAVTDKSTKEGIVYDPSSFWAHNEYELGNWRPARNRFSHEYFDAYHSIIPRSEPVEDYDDRNALYAIRFNLHAATLFPDNREYLGLVIDEMKRLIAKFPEGYNG
ncbi:Fructosamine kinase-domain-containing protein [Xylariomycetidae sp. FL2044]|nr:Fructosamine kinase-domain-containing protein [Xylariomycetidae sp. FL2044]